MEAGTATPEQEEAWTLIRAVTERIKEADHFLAGTELYRDKTLAGVDFNRLLQFMTDLHEAKDIQSYVEHIDLTSPK